MNKQELLEQAAKQTLQIIAELRVQPLSAAAETRMDGLVDSKFMGMLEDVVKDFEVEGFEISEIVAFLAKKVRRFSAS